MKYAVLFGSPNRHGSTAHLLSSYLAKQNVSGVDLIFAYDIALTPCMGCGVCRGGTCIQDDFYVIEDIYRRITSADAFILASPVYFNSVPAPLKCIIDRLQPYYIEKFVLGRRTPKKKSGTLLMCGGAEKRADIKAMLSLQLKYTFDVLGFELSEFLYEGNTDSG